MCQAPNQPSLLGNDQYLQTVGANNILLERAKYIQEYNKNTRPSNFQWQMIVAIDENFCLEHYNNGVPNRSVLV